MLSFEYAGYVSSILSLVGVVLNIKKKRCCFIIWGVSNSAWCIIDFYYAIYSQSALFFIYFVTAIWGYFSWKEGKRETN